MGRLIERTRSKRETFRILGRGLDDLHASADANIYNDHDFYQVLLSDFLQASSEAAGGEDDGHDSETERRFLGTTDLGLTQKFL